MDSQVRCGDSRGRRLRRKMQTMTKRFESQEKEHAVNQHLGAFLSSLQSSSDDNNPRPDTPPFNVQNDGAHDSPSASQDSQESNYTDHEPILCPSRFDFERLPTLAREGVAGRSTKVYPVIGFMLLTGNIIYGAQTR
ncbi:hypothetical protein DMENIID0001_005590 [Sergentomyia squamirostris]